MTACFPSNIEKQKVSLVLKVFHEKTAAALRCDGKEETAVFIEDIVHLWKVVNVKNPTLWSRLNDSDRRPIRSVDDGSLLYLEDVASRVTAMAQEKGKSRSKTLTSDTRSALLNTLHGLIDLSRTLLTDHGYTYVLLGSIQSDDLEAEFGKIRQMSGGCYYISVDQVAMSARLRKLSLYAKLKIKPNSHFSDACCISPLTEQEMVDLDDCASTQIPITEAEAASLYFICGYVTRKEKLVTVEPPVLAPEGEFLSLVSRGKLCYPPEWLFEFAKLAYSLFRKQELQCANRGARLFQAMLEQHFSGQSTRVCRRLMNCFMKGVARMQSEAMHTAPALLSISERKQRKFSSIPN